MIVNLTNREAIDKHVSAFRKISLLTFLRYLLDTCIPSLHDLYSIHSFINLTLSIFEHALSRIYSYEYQL